jgi:serine/threonine-protein kinase
MMQERPMSRDQEGLSATGRVIVSDLRADFACKSGESPTPLQIAGPRRRCRSPVRGPRPEDLGSASRLRIGRMLGPYRLLEWLGRGGQGDVWKSLRLEPFEELVALKILKPSLTHNPARMAQFRREAERGFRLVGPSLVPVYELGECDGYHYMTMPYVEGTPLRDVVRQRVAYRRGDTTERPHHFATMSDPDYFHAMLLAMAEAARALGHVHEQQVAHRDIKPANILLDNRRSGGVYLCDFGLGRDLEVATLEQMRDGAGTPMYMAPERLLLWTANEIKCDIYSMGVTICEALTLERPFRVPSNVTALAMSAFLAEAEPLLPRQIDPAFPKDAEAVIMKAMARDQTLRHESARELARELERCAASNARMRRPAPLAWLSWPRVRRPHLLSKRVTIDWGGEPSSYAGSTILFPRAQRELGAR